jgi:4-amino-4-deoxy-L-arabinose transferase-like glycosyltransferase
VTPGNDVVTDERSTFKEMKRGYLIIPILLAAAYLSLARLDNTYFWDDEALLGVVARNLIETGHLTGWDGRNLLAFRNGTLLDDDLRPAEPPLSYLLAAGSFKLLGVSTWSGRFPFVLAGLASLIVFVFLMREEFGLDSPLWLYSSIVFSLSVVFLLNIRQCRYYSPSILFSLLTFLAYRKCLQTKKASLFVFLAAAITLLFYANFMICAALVAAIAVLYAGFHLRQLTFAHLWKALPKATLPSLTLTCHFSLNSGGAFILMSLLTSVIIFTNRCCICSGVTLSSLMSLSTLLMNMTGLALSFSACLMTVSV